VKLTVPDALAGERVDRAVALLLGLTRAEVAALVDRGGLRVGGTAVKTRSVRVAAGDELEVEVPEPRSDELVPDGAVPFSVLHDDAHLIVVDKPAGVVVHPGAGVRASTLVHGLIARYPDLAGGEWADAARPGIVHRLDKETSGLLVVARTPSAHASLRSQLEARTMDRRYLALASGELEHDAGTIDAPVGRSRRDRTRMAVAAGGRDARTHYVVLERFSGLTLVECKLETGRTHQIRVHLSAIGHAVAGDTRYRGASVAGLRRPFLHACKLAFAHPAGGAAVAFESPLPVELDAAMREVRAAR
jgi:23S rRNA pseudouridine1911/1915/1917 synthase